jgi:hypothetical protein
LADEAYQRIAEVLDDETLAALAVVGQHPPELRAVGVALMPTAQRQQAYAYRLVERPADRDYGWTLSAQAEEICSLLAAAAPKLSEADRRRAEAEYAALVAEAEEDLRLDADGRPRESA